MSEASHQEAYQVRVTVGPSAGLGPWTRDSLRGALGVAQSAARQEGVRVVGIFAGPGYRELIRAVVSEELRPVLREIERDAQAGVATLAVTAELRELLVGEGLATYAAGGWVLTNAARKALEVTG